MTNTEPVESYEKQANVKCSSDELFTIAEKLPYPINIHPEDILKKQFPSAFSGGQKGERETMFA
jgi:hypothetical protein